MPRRAPGAEPLESRLRTHLAARLADRGAAGVAVAVGGTRDVRAVWQADAPGREPAFLVYSITKTFTAALALLLAREGRLSLEDPLARWFPEVDRAARITVRMLLQHTAGVPDYGGLRAYHDAVRRSPDAPWSFEEYAEHTWRKGLLFEPGTAWAYSNPGYLLVARILERAAGESYAGLVRSRICGALDLERTYVPESVADLAELAPAPSTLLSPTGTPREVRLHYHPGWVSHGVVVSTASEAAIFVQALLSGRLAGEEAARALTACVPVPQAPPRWRRPSYGLGVMVDPESPFGPVAGHGGGGPGYDASAFHAARLGADGATVCALCTVEGSGLAEELVFDAFSLL